MLQQTYISIPFLSSFFFKQLYVFTVCFLVIFLKLCWDFSALEALGEWTHDKDCTFIMDSSTVTRHCFLIHLEGYCSGNENVFMSILHVSIMAR